MSKLVQLTMSEEDAKLLMTSVGMFSEKRLQNIYSQDRKAYGEKVVHQLYGKDFSPSEAFDLTGAVYSSLNNYFDGSKEYAKSNRVIVSAM